MVQERESNVFYGVILSLTNQLREFLILLSWDRKEGDHISITNQLREFVILLSGFSDRFISAGRE